MEFGLSSNMISRDSELPPNHPIYWRQLVVHMGGDTPLTAISLVGLITGNLEFLVATFSLWRQLLGCKEICFDDIVFQCS